MGSGANLAAITDDLYRNHDDYISDVINDKIHFLYDSAHVSRMEGDCPQIDISTRWGEDDIIGKNIKRGYYELRFVDLQRDKKQIGKIVQ